MNKDEKTLYPGKAIEVTWDGRLCIHVGECGYSEGDLFIGGRDPWCKPDLVSTDDVVDVIKRCPTGALTFTRRDGGEEESASEYNSVVVSANGPLYLHGNLEIQDVKENMDGVRYRAALCRCGKSGNKPFCDNSHVKSGFRDYGAVGQKGTGGVSEGGKLKVGLAPNGPLVLSGNFSIVSGSGRTAWQGIQTALCRCGASKNKPFCDGSHKAAGFSDE